MNVNTIDLRVHARIVQNPPVHTVKNLFYQKCGTPDNGENYVRAARRMAHLNTANAAFKMK